MDAGSIVIALLTAAGAAAGPAALGALPDATAPVARCIAAPDEERSGSARSDAGVSAEQRAGSNAGLEARDRTSASSALAEELAQELADVVAESDDATSRRLAAALAAAGFEASAGSSQETAASRSDDSGLDSRLDDSRLDDSRLDDSRLDDSALDRTRLDDRLGERDGRLGRSQGDDDLACDGRGADQDTGANRSSDLEDVLSRSSERERTGSDRSSSPVEREDSGIAAALERGERTAE
ncbi:hypothetical protein [Pseudonocardia cypriaca]|uniref:Uncharacterized protein n=1 Tax=Pseudonocardia cypriaca TaxID=882449 RepID=A0A543FWJ7_9PSEU|nr:hypothetical protein [Pseudonocardia cypriaca]TQM38216.1 hypothetical protein FB388_5446 [Pseudonocardia cypriaca]